MIITLLGFWSVVLASYISIELNLLFCLLVTCLCRSSLTCISLELNLLFAFESQLILNTETIFVSFFGQII